MFAIEVETIFCASHALRLPAGGVEPSHGHNFHLTVKIACDQLDALETVLDFHLIEEALAGIIAPWKNRDLNGVEPFKSTINPSAERIAEHAGRQMQKALAAIPGAGARNLRLMEVRLTEAPGCLAIWSV